MIACSLGLTLTLASPVAHAAPEGDASETPPSTSEPQASEKTSKKASKTSKKRPAKRSRKGKKSKTSKPSKASEQDEPEADEASAPADAEQDAIPPPTPSHEALLLDGEARAAFAAGDYPGAAERWTRALDVAPERDATHMERYTYALNAATAYEQSYADSGDIGHLDRARDTLREYLAVCKAKYSKPGCNGLQETGEVRERLMLINEEVLANTPPPVIKAPPEGDVAVGGRPFDRTVEQYPVPAWGVIALFLGASAAAGGTAMIIYGTNDKFKATDESAFALRDSDATGTPSTGTNTGTGTGTGTSGSSTLQAAELSPETKGRLLIGFGSLVAALGVGMIVYGGIALGKHRRLNRRERLALTPSLGPGGGGLSLSGRF